MWSGFRLLLLFSIIGPVGISQDACQTLAEKIESGSLFDYQYLEEQAAARCPDIIGQLYLQKGNNQKAEIYFERYLKSAEKGSAEHAKALNSLGIILWNTGNQTEAVNHIQQSLNIRTKLYGQKHELIAASNNDLGLIWSGTDAELALDYYEKALKIYEAVLGSNNEKTIRAKINTGIAYRSLEFYGDATLSFSESLSQWRKLHPTGHPNEGFILNNIGRNKQLMNDLNGALKEYESALAIYLKFYGENHPEVASTYNLIGNIYNAQGEFEKSLEYYQNALIANSNNFKSLKLEDNPKVEHYLSANTLVNTLYYKSKALADLHFNKTLKFSDLKLSLKTLQSCDTLIDKVRQVRTNEEDKLALGAIASTVYETGVELCYAMGDVVVKKDQYYALSYYFAEKSKSAVLLEAISDANAKDFANFNQEDLAKEEHLKSEIAYLENQLADNVNSFSKAEELNKLVEVKREYELFIKELEANYPEYFDLKYNNTLPSIKETQLLLKENQVLLSYFVTDVSKRVYIFELSKDKLKVHNRAQPEMFEQFISGFRNGIYFKVKEVYLETAQALHDLLIPKLNKNINQLIIIPSGRLGTLPFEALVSSKVKPDDPYSEISYLNNKYSISYAYSAALIGGEKSSSQNKAFLCAPVNFEELVSLPGTEQELQNIDNIFKNQGITTESKLKTQATEELVKQFDFSNYKYVHLATHGVVNETEPAKSRIYLSPDESNDGNLYTGEIYNINLKTDLVTLSACETGLGKLSKGEGVIGLSRALLYAGANNITVSLWSVADNSTARLMANFYTNFANYSYSKALQNAKMELIQSDNYSEPYYWAPFILIGR